MPQSRSRRRSKRNTRLRVVVISGNWGIFMVFYASYPIIWRGSFLSGVIGRDTQKFWRLRTIDEFV